MHSHKEMIFFPREYDFNVDYSLPFKEQLEQTILQRNLYFPSQYIDISIMRPEKRKNLKATRIFCLVRFPDFHAPAFKIKQRIRSLGWEPADSHESVCFLANCPDLQDIQATIGCIGSVFRVKGKANYLLHQKRGKIDYRHITDLVINAYYIIVKNEAIHPII